jgi:fatty acid desaturase
MDSGPILNDISRMWCAAEDLGFATKLKRLYRPAIWRILAAIGFDWAIIGAAMAMAVWQVWTLPISALIIGNRQRALGNLMHDAAHGCLGHRRAAELIARHLLFWPMWTSVELYRREHLAHHRLLGIPARDVDLIHCEDDLGRPWLRVLWKNLTDARTWASSSFAHLARQTHCELGCILASWSALVLLLTWLSGWAAAFEFAGLWLVARGTAFHAITTFREISDHVGLQPGSLIGFTRNHTARGPLAILFHPHNNGYHLTHHLNPGMPYHALRRAHALLLQWPQYAAAAHCDSYFFGPAAAVASWVRVTSSPAPSRASLAANAAGRSGTLRQGRSASSRSTRADRSTLPCGVIGRLSIRRIWCGTI